jgi:ATP-dependent RNA helicase DDX41
MKDNKSSYLIQTKKDKKDERKQRVIKQIDEQEIYTLVRTSALLNGLKICKSERRIKSIADWKFPENFQLKKDKIVEIRDYFQINTTGEDILPPISNFKSMKFPSPIIKALNKLEAIHPSAIQMQGIPVV